MMWCGKCLRNILINSAQLVVLFGNMKKRNNFKQKISTVISKPKVLLIKILYLISPILSDRLYLKLLFPLKVGYKLNLKNPQTYNEKLQWLKLNYRDNRLPAMVDKYEYKQHVAEAIGSDYVVKNFGVWENFDDIDFEILPTRFVLKTTHDQGGVILCSDKAHFDLDKARKKINRHLKRNIFYLYREWPYKKVKPRVIAEEFLEDEWGDLLDYKFYCFDGEPKIMYIAAGRKSGETCFNFYDMNFNFLDIKRPGYNQCGIEVKKPENFDLMISLAKQLSIAQPHVRIDFYSIKGKIYVGEYTLFQGGGMMPFVPEKWDYTLGSWLDLDKVKSIS